MLYHHQIDPIFKTGLRNAAALLLHGFTGTPDHMRPLANHLHHHGFTVHAPLLPGHGTTREHLAKTGWRDWYAGSREAFQNLKKNHGTVFVVGLSLGGILTLRLAEEFADEVSAIACLATPLYLESWVRFVVLLVARTPLGWVYRYQKKSDIDIKDQSAKQNIWHINEMPINCIHSLTRLQKIVRRDLKKITCPTLLLHSRYDSTAPYSSMSDIASGISSKNTETVTLENSYHLITLDFEKDFVSERVSGFFERFSALKTARPPLQMV